jgi:hypothetical protein
MAESKVGFAGDMPHSACANLRCVFERAINDADWIEHCLFTVGPFHSRVVVEVTFKNGTKRFVWFNLAQVSDATSPSAAGILAQLVAQ